MAIGMRGKVTSSILNRCGSVESKCAEYRHWHGASYHHAQDPDEELPSSQRYRIAYAKLLKLTHVLRNIEHIDGRLADIKNSSIVREDHIIDRMQAFNSLAKAFIGSPTMQHTLKQCATGACFGRANERKSMTLNSLTKVCDFLNVSAQKRQAVRLTLLPQVTHNHIWRGALEETLKNLKTEMDMFNSDSPSLQMGNQILSSCLKLFADTSCLSNSDSPSWMRPPPLKKVEAPVSSRTWVEVLEMFTDLSKCLAQEGRLACHVSKLEVMKEGLYQIKDILVERDISYKEVRRQDSLVQRKLTKSLGHSSKCLFTLLLYYLDGTVRDIEVEVRGGVYGSDGRFRLCMGKILTSADEEMIWNGVKQLSRALGVFKLVWETAAMSGVLELQGHVWCVGAKERMLTYRGSKFFVHGIRL